MSLELQIQELIEQARQEGYERALRERKITPQPCSKPRSKSRREQMDLESRAFILAIPKRDPRNSIRQS